MFKSSPKEVSESARLMYLLSIGSAERSIKVGNAYFVPDDLTTQTLLAEAERQNRDPEIATRAKDSTLNGSKKSADNSSISLSG
jgi:phosphatidylserine/phosphatidylglycerophosphate/cardiolipin synthase-like enzyme